MSKALREGIDMPVTEDVIRKIADDTGISVNELTTSLIGKGDGSIF